MLDKFKFFNKDKTKSSSSKTTAVTKGGSTSTGGASTSKAGKSDGKLAKDGRVTTTPVARHTPVEGAGIAGGGTNGIKTASKPAVKKSLGHSRKDVSASREEVATPKRSGTLISSRATSSSNIASTSSVKRHLASAKSSDRLDSGVGKTTGSSYNNGSPGTGKKTSKIASLSGKGSTTKLATRSTTPTGSGTLAPPIGSSLPTKVGTRSSMRLPKDDSGKPRGLTANRDISKSSLSSASQSTHGASPRATPPPSDSRVVQTNQSQQPGHDGHTSIVAPKVAIAKSAKTNGSQLVPPTAGSGVPSQRISSAKSAVAPPAGDIQDSNRTHGTARALPQKSQSKKVDSDTQTAMSAVRSLAMASSPQQPSRISSPSVARLQSPHLATQTPSPNRSHSPCPTPVPAKERASPAQRECSNSSLSSNGTAHSCGAESNVSSSNSASNSNNSASSTESVIFRPSSCDELDDNDASELKPVLTDHISSLRNSRRAAASQLAGNKPTNKKMETTFDVCVHTEEKTVSDDTPKETVITEDGDTFDVDIKPMQPIMRSTPYSYLRGLNSSQLLRPSFHIPLTQQNISLAQSASSRLGGNRPLIDPNKLYMNSMRRTASNCTSMLETDYCSDADSFDVAAGYMSDGDILRSNHGDDYNCGYMSEGGATIYAKRMQQRFREGMNAVKECMQRSSGLIDDER